MNSFSLSHLPDHELLRDLTALIARDNATTATMLAHLGEVEARRLYAADGCPSMYRYCLDVLHFSEDAAYKRIYSARKARRFPAILPALAEGRLHLSAVVLLGPFLTRKTVDELLAAAEHKTKFEIAQMLAQRFPRSDVPTSIQPLPPATATVSTVSGQVAAPAAQHAPGHVAASTQSVASGQDSSPAIQLAPGHVAVSLVAPSSQPAPLPIEYTTVTPLSPGRYLLKGTLSQQALDFLNEAKALLAHRLPSGDLMHVIERLAEEWVAACKRRRQAATDNPRPRRSAGSGRYVPAEVERAVRERDGDRCTFTAESGRRCDRRTCLEFDHLIPVANGGRTTTENLRLRCRAHNQLEAERAFGREFMREKRESSRRNHALQSAAKTRERARTIAREAARASGSVQAEEQTPPPPAP